jgi:pyruvate kinase
MYMRKTKIVCTLGPATVDDEVLRELLRSGMNAARFNFSHGTHESHYKTYKQLERIRCELELPIPAILDTKGPEVRVRQFKDGKVTLVDGAQFVLTTEGVEGTDERVAITYKDLAKDIDEKTSILVDDGLIELKVSEINQLENGEWDIVTKVIHGGTLSDNKSCNFPGKHLSMPYVSERDRDDLIFGAETGFDFIAASFVRSAADVMEVRKILDSHGGKGIRIISKIESQSGVDNIEEIIRISDGIMVARGDMGVEIPFEELPHIQKELIKKGYNAGKQVITATQMLDSMIKNPRPTRAETTDVANAIYDGTSAIMLSGETAAGAYPVETVRTMAKIADRAESDIDYVKRFRTNVPNVGLNVTNAVAHAAVSTAIDLGAKAVLTVTYGGNTAKLLSRFRPPVPILSSTPNVKTWRQLNLSWGVIPIMSVEMNNTDELINTSVDSAEAAGYLESGDLVVITAGVPLMVSGTTNLMKVHMVGDVILRGNSGVPGVITGQLCVASSAAEAYGKFKDGEIIVVPETTDEILPLLKKSSGIITEKLCAHAETIGLAFEIPVITGAENAVKILKSGTTVTVDAVKGFVKAN